MAKLQKGINDLATVKPELAKQWNLARNKEINPSDVTYKSGKKVWWQCEYGHEWESKIINRTSLGRGCPYCSGQKVATGENDLQTLHPELARQWHPTKNIGLKDGHGQDVSLPNKISGKSGLKVWWQCEHGHEWETTVDNRVKGKGCPYCYGRYPIKGETDLETTHPELAKQWHPTKNGELKPSKVMAASNKKIWWKCSKNHEWEAAISERFYGSNCPFCTNKRIISGENDLKTNMPNIAIEWHPTKNIGLKDKKGRDISTPDKVSAGSSQKVWWKCSVCGHDWIASIGSRAMAGNGCPVCKESHGEKAVRKILEDNHILFEEQYKFNDRVGPSGKQLLRDDFALLDKKGNVVGTIEYNGEHHYKPTDFTSKNPEQAKEKFKLTQKRDVAKTKYLQEHNIPQLIIPYWKFDEIDNMVKIFIQEVYN